MTNPKLLRHHRREIAEAIEQSKRGMQAGMGAVTLDRPLVELMLAIIDSSPADDLTQLRSHLSLAEEGLANYALEVERLRGYWTGDKLTGGSDVCHTCHAHCVVIGDKDAEIEELKRWQLEARKLMNAPASEPSEGPADLVGALQDVVHTDPGPVRAGKSVKSNASIDASTAEASHYCIDCNEAHDPRTCGALKSGDEHGPQHNCPECQAKRLRMTL